MCLSDTYHMPMQNQVELQCQHSISQTDSSGTVNQQSKHSSSLLHQLKATLTGDKSSLSRTASLSTTGLMTTTASDSLSDSLEAPFGVPQSIVTRQAGLPPHTSASHINPDDIQLCRRPNGEHWVLGAGTFGVVSFQLTCMCKEAIYLKCAAVL